MSNETKPSREEQERRHQERLRIQEERKRRREEHEAFLERKATQAKQPNTKVVTTNTNDVKELIKVLQQTDSVYIRLRKDMGTELDVEICMPLINDFDKLAYDLHILTKKMSSIVNFNYTVPAKLERIINKFEPATPSEVDEPVIESPQVTAPTPTTPKF